MPKRAPELAPFQIKRLSKRPGFHSVGGVAGLHLYVKPTAAASWVIRLMVGTHRRDFGLGPYPDVSLADAREKAREIRRHVAEGVDPIAARRAARAALEAADARRMTFREAASAAWRHRAPEFRNRKHAAQWLSTLETYATPIIGNLNVAEIEREHVVKILTHDDLWTTKPETASRLRGRIEAVLAWARVNGYRPQDRSAADNPAIWRGNLDQALPKTRKIKRVQHHRALPWQDVPTFFAELRQREGTAARALELLVLTWARSGEVRGATWNEIDLDARTWTVPGDRMKAHREHVVPLSAEAMRLLKSLPRGDGNDYVFPAPRGGQLSDMALTAVLRRMGRAEQATTHGMRSSAKDWSRNATKFADEVSELALAHVSTDATRAAYARDKLLNQRRKLLADWSRYCTSAAADVVPIRRRA